MATLRASTSTRTSWATPFTITGRSIEFSLIRISIGYRRLPYLSIQIAVWTYRFFRWIDFQWIDSANMFLEYLPEPIAELFGFCAGALDHEDLAAMRIVVHAVCCHRFARGILSLKAPPQRGFALEWSRAPRPRL